MKKRLRFWVMTLSLALIGQMGHVAYAQNPQTIEVGPHFGLTSYIGELNVWRNLPKWDWKSFNQFQYDLGAVVRFNYDSRWAFRLDYSYVKVRACDEVTAWRPEAKLNFQSRIHDIALMTEFNFLNYYTGHSESSVSPYIFAGLSWFMFDTRPFTRDANIDKFILNGPDGLHADYAFDGKGYLKPADITNRSFSIPFGVGCKLSLSQHLATTFEWRMHYTFTDYLDDVSGVYSPDGNKLLLVPKTDENGNIPYSQGHPAEYEVAVVGDNDLSVVYDITDPSGLFSRGQQRGNSQTKDWFGMINLSITWKFVIPGNTACKMNIE